jgi:RNA processing factor Prp31
MDSLYTPDRRPDSAVGLCWRRDPSSGLTIHSTIDCGAFRLMDARESLGSTTDPNKRMEFRDCPVERALIRRRAMEMAYARLQVAMDDLDIGIKIANRHLTMCETTTNATRMRLDDIIDDELHSLVESRLRSSRSHVDEMDSYLRRTAERRMRNVSWLVGHRVASRLLARAGSLSAMAKMPSTTIQLLGCEKALFRSLRSNRPTPKYGIIYDSVASSPPESRGRHARKLANSLALAARYDYFARPDDDRFIREHLKVIYLFFFE